jgi:hypothetical protein
MVMSEIADFVRSKKLPNKVNFVVQSQGIASVAGRSETSEWIDRKLAVHYYGRVLWTHLMLPKLRLARDSGEEAVMLSVLSAGVHGAYTDVNDLGLKQNFSIKNAADAAGFYNDLALDHLASTNDLFKGISLQHAAPGVVATNWGSEFPFFLRYPVRAAQFLFGKAPEACAKTMVDAMLSPKRLGGGLHLFGESGLDAKLNAAHTPEIRAAVWAHTTKILDAALKTKDR